MLTDDAITRIIEAIMARRTGASGTAVFVDPVILRAIIVKATEA